MNAPTRINSALNVRDQFPAIAGWHYLDSAATAQKPQAVIDAITKAYAQDYATVHRGIYERSAVMTQTSLRARCRRMGGAASCFRSSSTTATSSPGSSPVTRSTQSP